MSCSMFGSSFDKERFAPEFASEAIGDEERRELADLPEGLGPVVPPNPRLTQVSEPRPGGPRLAPGLDSLLCVVDLRALELVAVVDVDGLPGREEVDGSVAFAVAVAGGFHSAEGQMHLSADGGRVDVGD